MNKKLHRWINTSVSALVLAGLILASTLGYDEYTNLNNQQIYSSEMNQIAMDEGFRRCNYNDSLGYKTIGFGHLVKKGESFERCISIPEAFDMLNEDYLIALKAIERNYPWAEGEIKLVLTNMSYQIGITRLMKFDNTIKHLKNEQYREAAIEMMDSIWAKQTPQRSMRLAVRILSLQE